ncbi:hypothetical protein [Rubritalea tangerina]|uniref:hypothetical protein n=1 Tax=Rubritalea tangerina TaxID=430798 RepID=UPI00361A712F
MAAPNRRYVGFIEVGLLMFNAYAICTKRTHYPHFVSHKEKSNLPLIPHTQRYPKYSI